MSPLKALHDQGQAVWLDFVARGFIADGHLKKLVDEDGLRGVTSNPAIFEKAIAHSDEYDTSLRSAEAGADMPVIALFEQLAIEDIRNAADVLRPVYDATDGADGFVSLEVSPYLALETQDTLAEARRLWREVGRENLMIKVPATQAGLPAIRHLIGEGINVNVRGLSAALSRAPSASSASLTQDRLRRVKELENIRLRINELKAKLKSLYNFTSNLTPFFFFTIGGYLVIRDRLSIGALVAALAAYKEINPALRELFEFMQAWSDARARYEEVSRAIDPDEGRTATTAVTHPGLSGVPVAGA